MHKTKQRTIELSLFTASTRPHHIQRLYEKAAAATLPVSNRPHMGKTNNVDDCFLMRCSPVLGSTRRKIFKKIDTEIETRIVSAFCSFFHFSNRFVRSFKYVPYARPTETVYVSMQFMRRGKYSISFNCIEATKVDVPFPSLIPLPFSLSLYSLLPLKISVNAHRPKRLAKLQSVRIVCQMLLAVHCISQQLAIARMLVSLHRTWTALMCRRRHPIQSMRSFLPQTMCHWTINYPHPKNNVR